MKEFPILLNQNQLKATPQRIAILEVLQKMGHLNVDDLFTFVKKKQSSVSLATIYTNVNSMINKMVLSEVKLPNRKSVYEIIKIPHGHLVCTKCNTIYDAEFSTDTLLQEASKNHEFKTKKTDIVLEGVCKNCS